jgi:hypothetical protein
MPCDNMTFSLLLTVPVVASLTLNLDFLRLLRLAEAGIPRPASKSVIESPN